MFERTMLEKPMLEKLCAVLVATTMWVLASAGHAAAQGTGTIWDGVYTSAQAARGKTTFEGTCARCHNPELTGSERGPALKGGTFLSHWEDDSLESVFNKIRDTMPPIGPNTLSEDIKIDILAYILQSNAYPAGTVDLRPTGSVLEGIKIAKKGIWNGVYTTAQAARGKTTFETACIRCHGADLTGTNGPPLVGDKFLGNWETDSLNSLFVKIRDTMPPNFGTILEPEAKLEILTYILQTNKFPAGSEDLKVDSEGLDAIQIVRKAGESVAAPNFALVQVVGCLSQGPNNGWVLTSTSAPVVTKEQTSTPEALKRAEAQPLGGDTFQLVSVAPFKPDLHRGHKVEAKGLLYRDPDDKRINLTSMQMVGSSCGQ
ncbi:MAG: cytochrome c [Acidobacteria bacterium]|nr:MAG: cytochrome c [Acidobacteriota bacterium]